MSKRGKIIAAISTSVVALVILAFAYIFTAKRRNSNSIIGSLAQYADFDQTTFVQAKKGRMYEFRQLHLKLKPEEAWKQLDPLLKAKGYTLHRDRYLPEDKWEAVTWNKKTGYLVAYRGRGLGLDGTFIVEIHLPDQSEQLYARLIQRNIAEKPPSDKVIETALKPRM